MLQEVSKEVVERGDNMTIQHVVNCDNTCVLTKKNKSYTEVQTVTEAIDFLMDYFKKYSPESIWGLGGGVPWGIRSFIKVLYIKDLFGILKVLSC